MSSIQEPTIMDSPLTTTNNTGTHIHNNNNQSSINNNEYLNNSCGDRLMIVDESDTSSSMPVDDDPNDNDHAQSINGNGNANDNHLLNGSLLPPPPRPPALLPLITIKSELPSNTNVVDHQSSSINDNDNDDIDNDNQLMIADDVIDNDNDEEMIEEGELEDEPPSTSASTSNQPEEPSLPSTNERTASPETSEPIADQPPIIVKSEEPNSQPEVNNNQKTESNSTSNHHRKSANQKRSGKKKFSAAGTTGQATPAKKQKMEKQEHANVSTWVRSVATDVDSESLGPCEPGTHVNLDGIVWNESANGLLVVNVTWRGKSYVGTLLDCTRYDWAPPRLCDSPLLELTPAKGSRSHKRGAKNNNNTNGSSLSASTSNSNGGNSKASTSSNQPGSKAGKVNARLTVNIPAPSGEQDDDSNHSSTNNNHANADSQLEPHSPVLRECPCESCHKQFSSNTALKYHQNAAHRVMRPVKDEPQPKCSPAAEPIERRLESPSRAVDNHSPSTSQLRAPQSVESTNSSEDSNDTKPLMSIKRELQLRQESDKQPPAQEPQVNLSPEESESLQKMFSVVNKHKKPAAEDDGNLPAASSVAPKLEKSSPTAKKVASATATVKHHDSTDNVTIRHSSTSSSTKTTSTGPDNHDTDSRGRSRSPGAYSDISDDGAPVLEKQPTENSQPNQNSQPPKHTTSASSQTMTGVKSNSTTPKSVAVVQPQPATANHLQPSPNNNNQLPTNAVSPNQNRASNIEQASSSSVSPYNHDSQPLNKAQQQQKQQPVVQMSQNTAVHLAGLSMPRVSMTPMLAPSMTAPAPPPTSGFVHHGFMGPPPIAYHPGHHPHMQPHPHMPFEMFMPSPMHHHHHQQQLVAMQQQQQQMQQQHQQHIAAQQQHSQQIATAGLSPGQQHKIHELKGGSGGSSSQPQMPARSHTATPPAAMRPSPQSTPGGSGPASQGHGVLPTHPPPFMQHSPHQYQEQYAMGAMHAQHQQSMQPK